MADALMNWDAQQSRWRKTYKGVALQIRALELGGTNATDTKSAANQWLRQEQARIDREKTVKTFRPNELEYIAELEGIQSAIKPLVALMRDLTLQPVLAPAVEKLKYIAPRSLGKEEDDIKSNHRNLS